jgi:uncharacterized protein YmfQ (DUF2313 family)
MSYRTYANTNGFIVNPVGNGDFTTITAAMSAITSAGLTSATVYLFDNPATGGVYAESFTIPAGVTLCTMGGTTIPPNIAIQGTITMTATGRSMIYGIRILSQGGYGIVVAGNNACNLTLEHCNFIAVDTDFINITNTNSSSTVRCQYCIGNIASNLTLFNVTGNSALNFFYCRITSSNTTKASTCASTSNGLTIEFCTLFIPLNISSDFTILNSTINCSAQNTTAITYNGPVGASFENSYIGSGTATAIIINAPGIIGMDMCVIQSSNAVTISGTGSANISEISSPNSPTINITCTVNPNGQYAGTLTLKVPLPVTSGGTGIGSTTINQLLYSSASNTLAGLPTANNGVLVTNSVGVPSIGTTLPTNVQGNITSTGNLGNQKNTTRSCFLAYKSSTTTNATGDGTAYQIAFDTVSFDQNSNFSTPNFTAPVTGKYQFNWMIYLSNLTVADTIVSAYLSATSQRIYSVYNNGGVIITSGIYIHSGSALISMSAGDTASLNVAVSGSTKTVSVVGSGLTSGPTYFSGYLVC